MKTNIHFLSYLVQFFLEWEMFQTILLEKIKTNYTLNTEFLKSCLFLDIVEKYGRAGQATDGNMSYALHSGYQRLQTHTQNK